MRRRVFFAVFVCPLSLLRRQLPRQRHALSVIAARCQLPQRGSPWHVGQVPAGRAKYDVPETVVLRCLGQQQLDKVRLSRSRCPRKQGPPFCAISDLRRPVESGPACQWLPLWGSWREAPERASPARKDRPCSDKQALCQSDAIAAPSNHRQHPCPLRHLR